MFSMNCMYGNLPLTEWGRFVRDGYGYAMHVRALLTHPLGLTLQPTSTICRSRRTEAPASLGRNHPTRRRPGPRSPAGQLTAPLPAVTVKRPPTTPVRGYIWSNSKEWNHWYTCAPCNAWTNLPHTGTFKIFHFGGESWNIQLGWKKKLPKVALIEEASLQWILKKQIPYFEQGPRKVVLQNKLQSARKAHIRNFLQYGCKYFVILYVER